MARRYYRFKPWMLAGHPGNITGACKRTIVRGVNHGLIVTATTDGQHAPGSYHYSGQAVDFGLPVGLIGTPAGRARLVAFQRFLVKRRLAFFEVFGPQNDLCVKNGIQITLLDGSPLENQHDNHDHTAPRRMLPWPQRPPQTTSAKGRLFLTRQEGVVPYAYNDSQGHATFGVGHLLHRGPVTDTDRRKWGTREHPKPMSLVLTVLAQDLEKYEACVRQAVGRRTRQSRFDACVSLAFNIGTGGFTGSTVAKRFRAKDLKGAGDAFLMWDKPPELRPRRERERALFLFGRYGR